MINESKQSSDDGGDSPRDEVDLAPAAEKSADRRPQRRREKGADTNGHHQKSAENRQFSFLEIAMQTLKKLAVLRSDGPLSINY